MADTEFETMLDKMIDQVTRVSFHVESREGPTTLAGPTLVRNHNYAMYFRVRNIGTEVDLVRLAVRLRARPNIQLFTNGTYGTPTHVVDLNWTNVGANEERGGYVYFRVTQDVTKPDIVHYGIYAVILPEGHVWKTLNWPANRHYEE